LLGNLFLMFLTAGMAEGLTLAKALDIEPAAAVSLFNAFNPGNMVPGRAQRMVSGEFSTPSCELAMARKDARLMLAEGARHQRPPPVRPAIAALMDHYLERGHGHDDWTVIAKDALAR